MWLTEFSGRACRLADLLLDWFADHQAD